MTQKGWVCNARSGITWLLVIPQTAHTAPPLSRKSNKMLRNWQLKDWRLEVKKPHQYKMNTWCAYRQDTHEMTHVIQEEAPKSFHSCVRKLYSKLWTRLNIIWRTAKTYWVAKYLHKLFCNVINLSPGYPVVTFWSSCPSHAGLSWYSRVIPRPFFFVSFSYSKWSVNLIGLSA